MKTSAILLPALAGLALSGAAAAEELAPLQAGTFEFGSHIASVYYTPRDGHFEVVTTVAPRADLGGAPAQFTGELGLGDKQIVSIGTFGSTGAPRTLELVHAGDHLLATAIASDMAAR